ncbi:unnamed protein product [Paramecium primaurelia]|uniref:Protein kinase domain-containing protein n=1 Tax=Paramecium primaurelia TaxID=5886 RepID=A0A8S1QA15_PARPR|nr:unnamed protein product [Paramecium primaurelia]
MSNYSPNIVDGFTINYSSLFGQGAFSTCYICTNPKFSIPMCVKIIQYTQKTSVNYNREIEIIQRVSKVDCKNLVKILHIKEQQNRCYIFMEYCLQGDFQKLIEQKVRMKNYYKTEEILTILKQLINGYKHLYDFGIIHRDIKPANILIGNNGCFQLADYGMSKILEDPCQEIEQSNAGTPYYAAPQILIEGIYSNKCDIYSFGVIIYQLVYQQMPFNCYSLMQFVEAVKKSKYHQIQIKNIPKALGGTQQEQQQLLNFLQSSLVYEESSRISWDDLFKQFLDPNVSEIIETETIQNNSSTYQLQTETIQHNAFTYQLQPILVSSQSKPQNDQNSQESTSLDNINNISQPKETQFMISNNKLKKANQTGEFKQANQESYENTRVQFFHSDQILKNHQDQQQTNPQLKQFKLQKKTSICSVKQYDNVLEKMINFYLAKSTFVDKLINSIENSSIILEKNQQSIQQSPYTMSLNILKLYLYGYQYSNFYNIYYLLYKRYVNANELQIQKELSWVDKKQLEEEIWNQLKNQISLKSNIKQQYKIIKQKFKREINRFQEYQKYITDSQLQMEVNQFKFKENVHSPQLYYMQYKKLFQEMYLYFDFEAEYDYLEDHTILFLAFSIKFFKNEEKYKENQQFLEVDKQLIIEFQESKRILYKTIKEHFTN